MVRRLLLALAVLAGVFVPGWAAASARPAASDHLNHVDAVRALAPAPASAVVSAGRSRSSSRCTTTGDRACSARRWLTAARSSAAVAKFSPPLHPAAPSVVRRRGPPQSTSA